VELVMFLVTVEMVEMVLHLLLQAHQLFMLPVVVEVHLGFLMVAWVEVMVLAALEVQTILLVQMQQPTEVLAAVEAAEDLLAQQLLEDKDLLVSSSSSAINKVNDELSWSNNY
jgi:hypothetical protein